jgi:hypothetical protein
MEIAESFSHKEWHMIRFTHQAVFRTTALLGVVIAMTAFVQARAQEEATAPSGLSLEQQRLASRFERLEAVAARLAELAESSEPERAEQLRRTIKSSREKGLAERFHTIVELLESERLSAATRDQSELQAELERLLQVLLEDPGNSERDAMKRFLKAQIRELSKLIRQQRSLRNQNEQGAESDRLAEKQADIDQQANSVQQALKQSSESPPSPGSQPEADSKPGDNSEEGQAQEGQAQEGQAQEGQAQEGQAQEGQSQEGQSQSGQPQPAQSGESSESSDPIQRAAERVAEARRAMQQAEQKLRDAKRREAQQEQRQAQRELEAAKAELERILRQLREEEMEQLLAKLAARFRDMLAAQQSIYDDTTGIFKQVTESESRNLMLQAIRLSRRESELVRDAEKALTLLREDGTSVAFPETTEQIAEDMRSVAARLAAADSGPITQTVELDIIAALEDMIAALDQARDELGQNQESPPQAGGGGGSPGESPLVSKIAELRMIRTLQARVYKRTQDLGNLADNPHVLPAELEVEVEKLAERQARIFQATRDLDTDRNR